MRRASIALTLLLAFATAIAAQIQGGAVSGVIKDEQGALLPGVEVTLAGPAEKTTFTTGADGQFRFLNVAPGTYNVTTALAGFGKIVRSDVTVTVGQSVTLPFTMKVATIEEAVTVSGGSPIIDTRKVGTSTNFTQDELSRIPNSRDPWALLRTVPGVVVDRINIAGNETGQQTNYSGKGTPCAGGVGLRTEVMLPPDRANASYRLVGGGDTHLLRDRGQRRPIQNDAVDLDLWCQLPALDGRWSGGDTRGCGDRGGDAEKSWGDAAHADLLTAGT